MVAASTISSQQEGLQRLRIVVADDSDDMRELISMVLRRRGFDVIVAVDGHAALQTIVDEGADGLVSDLCMPGLDGLTLCRCLRALNGYDGLPIVVYTGAAPDDERLCAFREFSRLRVLNKPMGLHEIAPSLAQMLDGASSIGTAAASEARQVLARPATAG